MSAHSYIYVTIFYFLNYLFFKKKFFIFFLKMMLTYHISHEKIFSTTLYVHGRSGVKIYTKKHKIALYFMLIHRENALKAHQQISYCSIQRDHLKKKI